jgi:hypothetical protein
MASQTGGLNYNDPEPLVTTLARLFAQDGAATEVAVLANANARIDQVNYDNWNGGTYTFDLVLALPVRLYGELGDRRDQVELSIGNKIQPLLRIYPNDHLGSVHITPELATDPNWREKAKAWVEGKHINNQGRVRSDNIASRECDGLLFRSQPEINLYGALKSAGVSFAPLPVFVRGGQDYQRIEPDFVILKDGIVLIVEVDGDTVHHELPAEAHARTTMLIHEGARIERVRAAECETPAKAAACAQKILTAVLRLKSSR